MSGRRPQVDVGGTPWPAWLRYLVLTLLFGVIGVGLVVALYDRGFLPLAGPFVALAVAPLLGFLGLSWLARRNRGMSRRAVGGLESLLPALEEERRLPRGQRSSGATDETLDAAARRARSALSQFAWGDDDDGIGQVDKLARIARPWSPDSPVAGHVGRVVASSQRLQQSRRRLGRRLSARCDGSRDTPG